MNWTDSLPESVRRDIREAGRGHLLGDYRSPLSTADEARKRNKEEPAMANTDAEEIASRQAPSNQVQNDGVDDIQPETVDDDIEIENEEDDDFKIEIP